MKEKDIRIGMVVRVMEGERFPRLPGGRGGKGEVVSLTQYRYSLSAGVKFRVGEANYLTVDLEEVK